MAGVTNAGIRLSGIGGNGTVLGEGVVMTIGEVPILQGGTTFWPLSLYCNWCVESENPRYHDSTWAVIVGPKTERSISAVQAPEAPLAWLAKMSAIIVRILHTATMRRINLPRIIFFLGFFCLRCRFCLDFRGRASGAGAIGSGMMSANGGDSGGKLAGRANGGKACSGATAGCCIATCGGGTAARRAGGVTVGGRIGRYIFGSNGVGVPANCRFVSGTLVGFME